MTEAERGWLAGVIDGEGSIGVYTYPERGTYNVTIHVSNTNRNLIQRVYELCQCGQITKPSNRNPGWKPAHRWVCQNRAEIQHILRVVSPYLVAKRQQAKLMLDWCETGGTSGIRTTPAVKKRRAKIGAKMRRLNKRGC